MLMASERDSRSPSPTQSLRLARKLLRNKRYQGLGKLLARELRAEERREDEETAIGLADGTLARSTAVTALHRPQAASCKGVPSSEERKLFRPIREDCASNSDESLAPSEVDFLEEVLLDAITMPRTRRTEGAAAAKYNYSPDFENGVIQRQRKELHLLVGELRERDRELNEMVAAHQRQMSGWESDRRRCVQLEEKTRGLDGELAERQVQVKGLLQRLEESERLQEEKDMQLGQLQERLHKLASENASTKGVVEEVEEANEAMENRLKELSCTIGVLEAREQEFTSEIKSKDAELIRAHQELAELSQRWKASEEQLRNSEKNAASLRAQISELNDYLAQTKKDADGKRNDCSQLAQQNGSLMEERESLQREILQLKKDIQLAAERDRRKEEIVQSQRLKLERTDAELAHLRHLYERMQKDLSTLQLDASSDELLERRLKASASVPASYSPSPLLTTLPPRGRPSSRNGVAPGMVSRTPARSPSFTNGCDVDALTRQHLEEYRSRYTPVATAGPSTLARVSSLPDLSPHDFVQAALQASAQSKLARSSLANGAV